MLSRVYNQGGTTWSKPSSGAHMKIQPSVSPVNTSLRTTGNISSSWPGSSQFYAAMSPFGMRYEQRAAGTMLPLVKPGQHPSAVYMNGMQRAHDFVRSGGSMNADGSYDAQMSGGSLNVEKI